MGKSKRSSKGTKRAGKSRKHSASVKRVKVKVVPGYTRVGGAYGRSIPCGPEKKFLDTVVAPTDMLGTAGTMTTSIGPNNAQAGAHFLLVPQGTKEVERIGNKICMTNFNWKGFIYLDPVAGAGTTSGGALVRYIFFIDKQANGAAPTFANIVTTQDIAGTTEANFASFINLDNRDRFEIIRDTWIDIGSISDTATQSYAMGNGIQNLNMFMKLGNRETVYNAGTAGTVGDITSGSLYCFLISNNANASGVTANLSFRVRFTDQ